MARIQPLTPARRVLLQVVLGGVLLATVGLAALTERWKEGAMAVELTEPQSIATLKLRLPQGWAYEADTARETAAIFASSPDGTKPLRRLEVHHYANPRNMSPEQFLSRPSVVHPDYPRDLAVRSPVAQLDWAHDALIAGVKGVALEGRRLPQDPNFGGYIHEVFICGQVDGALVLVKLQAQRSDLAESSIGDQILARKVAESITIEQPLGESP